MPGPRSTPQSRTMTPRFPWITHLVAPLAVAAFAYLSWAGNGGFTSSGWAYLDLGDLVVFSGGAVLVVAVPATVAEVALLVLLWWRWPARVVVVLAAWFAFLASHFVAAFNLSNEPTPVDLSLLVPSAVLYAVYAAAQALLTRWLVGLFPVPTRKPLDERPLLVRLGLVEAAEPHHSRDQCSPLERP